MKIILSFLMVMTFCGCVYANDMEGDYISKEGVRSQGQELGAGDYTSEEGVRTEYQDLGEGDYLSKEGVRTGDSVEDPEKTEGSSEKKR